MFYLGEGRAHTYRVAQLALDVTLPKIQSKCFV